MTTRTDDVSTRIVRCAVCKIDLKGRFVFVDDASEQLFGHTKEDLFGKFFIDFVEDADKDIVNLILHKRNHYESFFDSTHLRITGVDRKPIEAAVVISLNFIAGNPVNFQIIINSEPPVQSAATTVTDQSDEESLLADLLNRENLGDWKRTCRTIADISHAGWVLLYRISDGDLDPFLCTSPTEPEALGFAAAPELTALHRWVVDNDEEYDFTDHDMVRLAIERDKIAPSELVTLLSIPDGTTYLLRLVFSEATDAPGVHKDLARVRLFTRLLMRLTATRPLPSAVPSKFDNRVQFKDLCDDLQIGVCFAKASGVIVDWNMTCSTMLDIPADAASLSDIIESLGERNRPELLNGLLDYLAVPAGRARSISAATDIVLNSGEQVRATLRQLVGQESESCMQLTLMPVASQSQGQKLTSISTAALAAILGELQSPLQAATRISETLGHEYFNELGRDGNMYLQSLGDKLGKLDGMISDLATMVALLGETEEPHPVDLNLLALRVVEDVARLHPALPINIHYHDLPKVTTYRRKLSAVLRLIISNAVRFAGDKGADITLGVEVTDKSCVITIVDTGPGIPAKYLSKVTEFFYRAPDPTIQSIPGRGTGLAIARQLLLAAGGALDVTSKPGKGTTVTLTFPVM